MVISVSHALYLISLNTLCNVNLFILIQGANKVVVVVVVRTEQNGNTHAHLVNAHHKDDSMAKPPYIYIILIQK